MWFVGSNPAGIIFKLGNNMHGIIDHLVRENGRTFRKSYRVDGVTALAFQEKVRYFLMKNTGRVRVLGTMHFRFTGKTMPVDV